MAMGLRPTLALSSMGYPWCGWSPPPPVWGCWGFPAGAVQSSSVQQSQSSVSSPSVSSSRLGGVGVAEEEEASQPSAGPPATTCCLPPAVLHLSCCCAACLPPLPGCVPAVLCSPREELAVLCRVIPTRTRQSTPHKKIFLASTLPRGSTHRASMS